MGQVTTLRGVEDVYQPAVSNLRAVREMGLVTRGKNPTSSGKELTPDEYIQRSWVSAVGLWLISSQLSRVGIEGYDPDSPTEGARYPLLSNAQ